MIALVAVAIAAAAATARASAAPLTEFDAAHGHDRHHPDRRPRRRAVVRRDDLDQHTEIGRITTSGTITTSPSAPARACVVPWRPAPAARSGSPTTERRRRSGRCRQRARSRDHRRNGGLNPDAVPNGMETAPDGTVWFLDTRRSGRGRDQPPREQITEYPGLERHASQRTCRSAPTGTFGSRRTGAVAQPGVSVWRSPGIRPTRRRWLRDNSLAFPMTMPNGITADQTATLGSPTPGRRQGSGGSPARTVSESESGGLQMGAEPDALTTGPDGNVWFDDQHRLNARGRKVTPAGQITSTR